MYIKKDIEKYDEMQFVIKYIFLDWMPEFASFYQQGNISFQLCISRTEIY